MPCFGALFSCKTYAPYVCDTVAEALLLHSSSACIASSGITASRINLAEELHGAAGCTADRCDRDALHRPPIQSAQLYLQAESVLAATSCPGRAHW